MWELIDFFIENPILFLLLLSWLVPTIISAVKKSARSRRPGPGAPPQPQPGPRPPVRSQSQPGAPPPQAREPTLKELFPEMFGAPGRQTAPAEAPPLEDPEPLRQPPLPENEPPDWFPQTVKAPVPVALDLPPQPRLMPTLDAPVYADPASLQPIPRSAPVSQKTRTKLRARSVSLEDIARRGGKSLRYAIMMQAVLGRPVSLQDED